MLQRRTWQFILAILFGVQSSLTLVWILLIPGEESSAVFLGLSPSRLLLVLIPLGLLLFSIVCIVLLLSKSTLLERWIGYLEKNVDSNHYALIFLWISMTCVTLILSGRVVLGLAEAVMQRLTPVLLLISMFAAEIGLFVWFDTREKSVYRQQIEWKPIVSMAGIVITLSVAGVIVGINPALHSHHYSAAGLPILPAQISISIYVSVCSAILANFVKRNILIRKILPILISIAIFLVAALMWTRVPIQETYFTQPSNLGDGSFVPNSDSLTYDSNAQLMLLGKGLAGGDALPRPLYSFILGILHLLVGTGITEVINAQTIILALIPVGLYLLGRKINSPSAGVLAAFLFIFRENNQAVLSSAYTLSSVRMLMSEPIMAGSLVVLMLSAFKWLQHPSSRTHAFVTGLLLGLSALIRTQVFVLLPLLLLWSFLVHHRLQKQWLKSSLWLILGLILVVFAWMGRNALRNGAFVFEDPGYSSRTLVANEGEVEEGGIVETAINSPGEFFLNTASYLTNNVLSSLYQLPWGDDWNLDLTGYKSQHPEQPFYPAFTPEPNQILFIMLHLGFIAFGLAGAWRIQRWSGMLPMAIYIGYALSTSVVGFSGWRYILPVDWIILFYWATGLFEAGRLLLSVFRVKTEPDAEALLKTPTREWRIGILLAAGLLVGLLIPVGESFFPRKMGELGQDDILNKIKASPPTAEILTLAEQPDSQVVQGMLFYPMALLDEDDFARLKIRSSWIISERPVLKFVVAYKNKINVILPIEEIPQNISNAIPVIVVGCSRAGWMEASALLVDTKEPYWIYSSQPVPANCEK